MLALGLALGRRVEELTGGHLSPGGTVTAWGRGQGLPQLGAPAPAWGRRGLCLPWGMLRMLSPFPFDVRR